MFSRVDDARERSRKKRVNVNVNVHVHVHVNERFGTGSRCVVAYGPAQQHSKLQRVPTLRTERDGGRVDRLVVRLACRPDAKSRQIHEKELLLSKGVAENARERERNANLF